MGIREYLPHLDEGTNETREWIDRFNEAGHKKLTEALEGKHMQNAEFVIRVHDRKHSCIYKKGKVALMSQGQFDGFMRRFPGCLRWQQELKVERQTVKTDDVVEARQGEVPGAPPRKMSKKDSIGKKDKE